MNEFLFQEQVGQMNFLYNLFTGSPHISYCIKSKLSKTGVHGKTTYEWHTSTYEWHTEYIRVTYRWHTSIYKWHTDDIRVNTTDTQMIWHTNDIRVTYEWHAVRKKNKVIFLKLFDNSISKYLIVKKLLACNGCFGLFNKIIKGSEINS